MYSISHLFIFAQLSLALPNILPRTSYADTSIQLREDLRDDWYSDFDSNETDVKVPKDAAGFYSCAGPFMGDYPNKTQWLDFDTLWDINEPEITAANGGDEYIDYLREAIEQVSMKSKVDARLILTLVLQESSGNVSIPCTGTTDCGLLQHRGSRKFDPSHPQQSIKNMLIDGIYGTAPTSNTPRGWPGYLQIFNGLQDDLPWLGNAKFWRGNPFAAGHVYNAGSIRSENLTVEDGGVERSRYYANDMVSRLQGWNGRKAGCLKSRGCEGHGFEEREC